MGAASSSPASRALTTTATMVRPRLLERLDEALARRLTSILAGPGAGKTTLLAQWAERQRAVWHTAVAGESDASLMRSIIDGLRAHIAVPDAELLMAIDRTGSPRTDADPARIDALASVLCYHIGAELDPDDDDLAVIIDDLHVLPPGGDVADLIASIVRHAPPPLHVVLASRTSLPFPTSRMLIDGLADEILAGELAFTTEETEAMLGEGAAGTGNGQVAALVARTGGWAAAIAFAARAQARSNGRQSSYGDQTDRQLFAYLAEEVLAGESAETMAALRTAAMVPWITAELAGALGLGEHALLADPGRTSITMTPVTDVPGAVTVTPLVRELLVGDTVNTTPAVRLSAAEWYEDHGALGAALWCLDRSPRDDGLAGFLRRSGTRLVADGHAADVLSALAAIASVTPSAIDAYLARLWAEAHLTLGEVEQAIERYRSTIPDRGPVDAAVAWRLGSLYYMRSETAAAKAVLDRAELDGRRPADEAGVLAWAAAIHWSRGDRAAAVDGANRALEMATAAGDSRALATAHTMLTMVARVDGDHVAHHSHYARALEHAERAKDLLQIVRIRCNNGSHLTEDGEYAEALAELDRALHLADLGGFGMWRAMCLTNRAEALIGVGRFDEAVADLEPARVIFQRVAPPMDAYPLELLGQVYLARGDVALAAAAFEEAAVIASEPVEVQVLVPALAGLAMARVDNDPAAALEIARRAAALEATVHHVKSLVALGWVTAANEDTDEARTLAERAITLARSRGDRAGLAQALELAASVADVEDRHSILTDARSLWSELGTPFGTARVDLAVAELASVSGDQRCPDNSEGVALAESAALRFDRLGAKRYASRARAVADALRTGTGRDLAVQVLGGFAVMVNGAPIPTSSWQSKVARDLFKMLVINRGRPIHREVLIERLWPGEFGDKASNRLSVALSAIRNATDPHRAHPADHVVIADRDSVALNLANVDVDVDQFLAESTRGYAMLRQGQQDQGLALLRLAESRYVGDVLEEQPYADWALPVREEALAMFLSVATVLADADAAAGDHESAARRCLRMIERDSYSENAYLAAIAAMRAAGHHGAAQRLYGGYVAKMSEIDVEPATFPAP